MRCSCNDNRLTISDPLCLGGNKVWAASFMLYSALSMVIIKQLVVVVITLLVVVVVVVC